VKVAAHCSSSLLAGANAQSEARSLQRKATVRERRKTPKLKQQQMSTIQMLLLYEGKDIRRGSANHMFREPLPGNAAHGISSVRREAPPTPNQRA